MMDIETLIKNHLTENGFDGLVNPIMECSCNADELAPCENLFLDCEPGKLCPAAKAGEAGTCTQEQHVKCECPDEDTLMFTEAEYTRRYPGGSNA